MPMISEAEYEALEGLESEAAEAAGRAPIKRASTTPSFRPRPPATPTPNYVTQVQLEAALSRVDGKIKTVDSSVAAVNARVAASVKREADERKKSVDSQTSNLSQKMQLLAMLPVLITQPSATLQTPLKDASGNPTITAISTPDTNTLDALLPLLLVSGLGGVGGFGGSTDGSSSDNSMLLMALVLAMSQKSSS